MHVKFIFHSINEQNDCHIQNSAKLHCLENFYFLLHSFLYFKIDDKVLTYNFYTFLKKKQHEFYLIILKKILYVI